MTASLQDLPDEIDDLPPSSKLVLVILQEADTELTQTDVANRARLSTRTVRFALRRLEEADIVESRQSLSDARQWLYWTVN